MIEIHLNTSNPLRCSFNSTARRNALIFYSDFQYQMNDKQWFCDVYIAVLKPWIYILSLSKYWIIPYINLKLVKIWPEHNCVFPEYSIINWHIELHISSMENPPLIYSVYIYIFITRCAIYWVQIWVWGVQIYSDITRVNHWLHSCVSAVKRQLNTAE